MLDIVVERVKAIEAAMVALAAMAARAAAAATAPPGAPNTRCRAASARGWESSAWGRHNLLRLDEPTDNLDMNSAEALEAALEGFEGAVVAVTHDRAFLKRLDRHLFVGHDGSVVALPDAGAALEALS